MLIDTKKSPHAKVHSIPMDGMRWHEGFWLDRFNTCADVTIPHILSVFADKDSFFHQVENFRIAAGLSDGEFRGTPYGDGDFYKLMEGMIYTAAMRNDTELDRQLDEYIQLIAAAQQPDGYLSTKQIIGERKGTLVRHSNIDDFEEYNFGHMFTAASVHKRLLNKDNFLDIARKCAGYLKTMFQMRINEGKAQTAVCPSHYMGLFELYRITGEVEFLELGKTAIALRDLVTNGADDNQDRIPLREHRKIVGHAVRSTYLYAGATDLFLETGDETLPQVLDSVWDNLMNSKIYITGGCGPLYTGTSPFGHLLQAQYIHQAFGYEYQLPNITAYNETCGTLGHIFWAHRMFMREPKAEYLDLIEKSYYNLVLASVSLDGGKYFYENMLRRTKSLDYQLMWPLERSDMFKCFCCPTNISRSIPEAIDYSYKVSDDSVWCGMYSANEATIKLENSASFTLKQTTNYPWDGKICLNVQNANGIHFKIKVRIPGWVESGSISHDSLNITLTKKDANTFIDVPVSGQDTSLEILFDMPVRLIESHAKVEENIGQVAVTRGPLVYCIESHDLSADVMNDIMLLSDEEFVTEVAEIKGYPITTLRTKAATTIRNTTHDPSALYQPLQVVGLRKLDIRMIPYFAWDNRGFGEMRIWIPVHYRMKLEE